MKTKAIAGMIATVFLLSMVMPVFAPPGWKPLIAIKDYSVTLQVGYVVVAMAQATLRIYSGGSFSVEVSFIPFVWPTQIVFWTQCAFVLGSESYNLYGSQDGSATDFYYFEGNVNYGHNFPFWYWYGRGYCYNRDWPGLLAEYNFMFHGSLTGDYTWTQLRLTCYLLGGYHDAIRFGQDFKTVSY